MSASLSKGLSVWSTFIVLAVTLTGCLIWQAIPSNPNLRAFDKKAGPAARVEESKAASDSRPQKQQLSGDPAQRYLQQTSDGQSLMQAVTAARFGLKPEESDPISGKSGPGYLGMSHDQNLNAWFDETGATIRPTGAKEQKQEWQLALHLMAYGYGSEMQAAPPIVAHNVKGARIEYERKDCQLPIANCRFEEKALAGSGSSQSSSGAFRESQFAGNDLLQSALGNRHSAITEWYENRSEGIEQGFTINERPARSSEVAADVPLRVTLGITGELRASVMDAGQRIELVDARGKSALSYSKLTAVDANNQQLVARMEASNNGREITFVLADQNAAYPIVIDPIVASQEAQLNGTQVDSRFGFAVAIDEDRAVVGAWREDYPSQVDVGVVYTFTRSSTSWSLGTRYIGGEGFDACGWSVATSGGRFVYGCPGAFNQRGTAVLGFFGGGVSALPSANNAGDQVGYSVAIGSGDVAVIMVGAPFFDFPKSNNGEVLRYVVDSSGGISLKGGLIRETTANAQFGTAVAIDGDLAIVGSPGAGGGSGQASVFTLDPTTGASGFTDLGASDAEVGDNFGDSVAISGSKAVIGAWGDDDGATDSGAAYVFVRNANGSWSQQQKIKAAGGRAGDHFSEHAVAIEGNTIVVGANGWDSFFGADNAGAVYIFTLNYVFTSNTSIWTQQTELDGASAYNFGIGVDISGDSVLIGARGADVPGTARAGAAYVYHLDCTAPYNSSALILAQFPFGFPQRTVCPGDLVTFVSDARGTVSNFQWRKNEINISGATSSTYEINSASFSDAGRYDVVISSSCGSEISSVATLSVFTFSLSPTSGNFGAGGSDGSISVTSTGGCAYTAVANASWIKITSNGSGTAPKNIGFHVDPNTGPNQRTGAITIGDKTFTVTQDGLNCSYSIAPTAPNFVAGSNTSSINVTATAGCAWTAISNDGWLTITSGSSGTGNGVANFSVAANTGPARTGTLTVAGQTVTVTQANGCTFALNPTAQTLPANIAAGAVTVTSGAGCAWAATSNAAFINVTSGASGTGNGNVGYSVTVNDTINQRTGTMTIGGQTFAVTQDGATPTPTPTPTPMPTPTATPTPTPTPTAIPTPRSKKTGVFRPSTGELFLKNANSSGFADTYIIFGNPGDYPVAGDWNGDGVDSVGIYRNGVFYLRNTNTTGFADLVVPFGSPGDQPIAGDWNGDGVDTIGIYRNGTFILRNSNTAGPPDLVFTLGDPGDVGIAGDWNGDGIDTCGVFRPSNGIVYLKNTNITGFADLSFVYGNAGDKPVAGDWNADGIDTIGIDRNGVFYLTNSNTTGFADIVFVLGNSGDFPIAGNWNGSP